MATGVLVIGASGSGKTTGVRTLDPTKTFIINSDQKDLSFQGWKNKYKTVNKADGQPDWGLSNYYETTDPTKMLAIMSYISKSRPDINTLVIDTINGVMIDKTMRDSKITGFAKWNDLADVIYNTFNIIPTLREDLFVFILGHDFYVKDEETGFSERRLAVEGQKLIRIKLESKLTTVFYTDNKITQDKAEYRLRTRTNGRDTCKTPMGMFKQDELYIPNDYKLIRERVRSYYEDEVTETTK